MIVRQTAISVIGAFNSQTSSAGIYVHATEIRKFKINVPRTFTSPCVLYITMLDIICVSVPSVMTILDNVNLVVNGRWNVSQQLKLDVERFSSQVLSSAAVYISNLVIYHALWYPPLLCWKGKPM